MGMQRGREGEGEGVLGGRKDRLHLLGKGSASLARVVGGGSGPGEVWP